MNQDIKAEAVCEECHFPVENTVCVTLYRVCIDCWKAKRRASRPSTSLHNQEL